MRNWLFVIPLAVVPVSQATAQERERFVERTPAFRNPIPHTDQVAGYPTGINRFATPSLQPQDLGGYIGGGKLHGNGFFQRGASASTGALVDGTYGTDYTGPKLRPNRVFLGASPDPGVGPSINYTYRTEGPFPKDVFALRPIRKAVLEKREVAEKRMGGGGHE